MAENPDGSGRPVWDPGDPGSSGMSRRHARDYTDPDAAEPSSSMPVSSSAPSYSSLSSVPIFRPHNFTVSNSRTGNRYPDTYEISGSQSGMYQPSQSSYEGQRRTSPVDRYHGVSSVNEAYPALHAAGSRGYGTAQGQAVGSSGIPQSGHFPVHQLMVGMENPVMGGRRVISPVVDSTVDQSAASLQSTSTDTSRTPALLLPSSSGQPYMPLHAANLQPYPQSEVTTSGGTPPPGVMMPGQGRRDLDVGQGHSEAEILNVQGRRHRDVDMGRRDNRNVDMEQAVSSISGSMPEDLRERARGHSKPSRRRQMQEVMSGEPDTTQDSDDELRDFETNASRSYIGNTSSLDDSEAMESSVAASTSMSLPSTSNVIDSVMENEQLSSRQITRLPFGHQLSNRMNSARHLTNQMATSRHQANQQTPSSSSQFSSNEMSRYQNNARVSQFSSNQMPSSQQATNQIPSSQQATNQMPSSQQASNQMPSSRQSTNQLPSSQQTSNPLPSTQQPANQMPSTQQASKQISEKLISSHFIDNQLSASKFAATHMTGAPQSQANQITEQINDSIRSNIDGNQMQNGNVLSSSTETQYMDIGLNLSSSAADSSVVMDQDGSRAMQECEYILKGEPMLDSTLNDGEEPGTSVTQSNRGRRKSSRIATLESENTVHWHRQPYTAKSYNPNHLWCEECMTTYEEECPTHKLQPVSDKIVFSRAWASLPPSLQIFRLDQTEKVELGVFAKRAIPRITQYGPFVADLVDSREKLTNDDKFLLMVERSTGDVVYYDASDENKCNWMMFVRPATTFSEQNLVAYQHGQDIYFSVTKPIEFKAELKVWYANHYAEHIGQELLTITEQDITAMEAMACKFQCYECDKRFRTAGARQKHLAMHDDTMLTQRMAIPASTTTDDEPNDGKTPGVSSQNTLRKKIQKIKDMTADSPGSSTMYHWKKRSTNIYLNKTLKKYQRRQESEAMRKSVQTMYRKTGKDTDDNKWVCNSCDLTFDNSNLLNLHTLTHAAEDAGLDEIRKLMYQDPNLQLSDPQSQDSGIGYGDYPPLACPVCQLQFNNKHELIEHISEHGKMKNETHIGPLPKPYKCDKCWKAFATTERLQRHLLVHGDDETKPLQCQVCFKRFMNNSALSCHVKIHSSDKYYECPICRQGFDSAAAMREHSFVHAGPDGLFKCPSCEKQFAEFLVLKKHIRGFHTNKTFFCPHCDKVFPRTDKLRLHMLRHSNHREFMCDTCGHQFKRKDKLKEHIKRMHSLERVIRDIQRSVRPSMKKFMPKVSPFDYHRFIYKCHLCLLGFKRRGMLVNHLAKRHPDVTPDTVPELNLPILKTQRDYYCQYCDKVYKSSSKRKSHILKNHPGAEVPPNARKKLATTEDVSGAANPTYSQTVGSITTMPQQCEYCHKQYASKAKLLQHQRKKHMGLIPQLPERPKRETVQQQIEQEAAEAAPSEGTMIHVIERYEPPDGQQDNVQAADLLTQAMSELTQSLQEYRQNTPGMPEGTYHVQARVGNGPPTMVQIQPAGSSSAPSTIELSQLNQALAHFVPGVQGQVPIQVSITTTGAEQIQIPVVTTQTTTATSGTPTTQIVTVDQLSAAPSSPPAAGSPGQGQTVTFPPLSLVPGAYIPKSWTNYTYK